MADREPSMKQLCRTAMSVLPTDAVVALKPDHPLLISGPDILIGSRGSLVAAFFVKARERARSKELIARLTASRLALPEHTKCIVVLTDKDTGTKDALQHFDFAYEGTLRPSEITSVMAEPPTLDDRRGALSKIREEAYISYSAILHVHRQKTIRKRNETDSDDHWLSQRSHQPEVYRRGSSQIWEYQDSLIGMKRTGTQSALTSALYEYAVRSFNENYVLHQGIPEPQRRTLDVAAYSPNVSRTRRDPEKPVRVAAFAGWLLADPEALSSDLDVYMDEVRRLVEKARFRIGNIQRRSSHK